MAVKANYLQAAAASLREGRKSLLAHLQQKPGFTSADDQEYLELLQLNDKLAKIQARLETASQMFGEHNGRTGL